MHRDICGMCDSYVAACAMEDVAKSELSAPLESGLSTNCAHMAHSVSKSIFTSLVVEF